MTIAALLRTLLDGSEGADTRVRTDARDRTGMKFRIKVAVALLLLYAAMHLIVGGFVHLANADLPIIESQIDAMPD